MLISRTVSLMAMPFMSWISGAIQYKLFPKVFGKMKISSSTARKYQWPNNKGNYKDLPIYDSQAHSRVAAKVWGDSTAKTTEKLLIDKAIKPAMADDKAFNQAVDTVGDSISIDLYEANLKNALEEGKKVGTTVIINYAGTILEDRKFGDKWVEKLYKEQPAMKQQKCSGSP